MGGSHTTTAELVELAETYAPVRRKRPVRFAEEGDYPPGPDFEWPDGVAGAYVVLQKVTVDGASKLRVVHVAERQHDAIRWAIADAGAA